MPRHQEDRQKSPERKRAWLDATAGAAAGCVARFVVGPLDVLKIRFQVQLEPLRPRGAAKLLPQQVAPKYTGLVQALRTIVREEGIQVCLAVAQPFPTHDKRSTAAAQPPLAVELINCSCKNIPACNTAFGAACNHAYRDGAFD